MKRLITWEDGSRADVDAAAFDRMIQAMKDDDPKGIVKASVECLLSSKIMMKNLVDNFSKAMDEFLEQHKK